MESRHTAPAALVQLALAGTLLLWGLSFVASKYVLERITPPAYMAVRFAIAAPVMVLIQSLRGWPRLSRRQAVLIALTALAEPVAYFIFESYGIRLIPATLASLIIATIPLVVLALAALLLGEAMTRGSLAAVLMSLAGIALLVLGAPNAATPASGAGALAVPTDVLAGTLLMLGAVLAASFYTVLARKVTQDHEPFTVTTIQVLFGGAVFIALLAALRAPQRSLVELGTLGWLALVFLSLGATVGAFFLYNWALRHETAGRVSLYLNGIPVVTAIAGWALLGEQLEPLQWLGAALVLIAVGIGRRPLPAPPAA